MQARYSSIQDKWFRNWSNPSKIYTNALSKFAVWVFSTLCIKTSSFGKIDSIVNDNGVMASNGDFIYGRVASRETAVEAVMNQSCFLVHFVVRARSFPKINTF
jgi:hypothetical protein